MARVLVLDENKYLRMLYALELASEGHEVVLAADDNEALERLQATRPDIVVMDLCGRSSGPRPETAELLKKISHLPLIVNTALELSEDNWLVSAADAFIIKSSDFATLKAKIRELLVRPSHQEEREVLV